MSKFLSPRLGSLCEYVPGEQPQDRRYIKLNTNESPFPPTPSIYNLLNNDSADSLRLYCDPCMKKLTDAACEYYGVESENVIFANGSDEILSFAFTAFCDSSTPAVFADITYGFYKVFAELNTVLYKQIPLMDDFSIDVNGFAKVGGTIFIANPNAPTGKLLSLDEIRFIVSENRDNVVVIDEAYIDFGGQSALPLIYEFENLLVVQTFSKSRSLAGARLGLAIGSKPLIADLQKIRNSNNPYNVNTLTQLLGVCALKDKEYFLGCTSQIIKNRSLLSDGLTKLGFTVIPSFANFVFAKDSTLGGGEVYKMLKQRGILVRHFDAPRISEYNRITVGSAEEINALLSAISDMKG